MGAEWPIAPLDELVDDILDRRGVTPQKLGSDFVASGHRVISAKLIKNRRVDLAADEPRFVDRRTYRKWMRTSLQADDVILTSEAPLGEVAYLREPLEWCLGQRLFDIRTNKKRLHGRFLYYALQADDVVQDLRSRATGTTVLGIRQSELRRVQIPVPPMDEQLTIAHTLGTLDDKIELNRRMNETLEAMARALFKAWFVDFDPVRAKAEGRDTGLPPHIANLFPDEFEDSELGEIPKGWMVATVGDVSERITRGIAPSYIDDGGIRVINQKCIRDRRINWEPVRRHDAARRAVSGRELELGDILVNSTGVGTLGRVAQVWRLDEVTVPDGHVTLVRAAPQVVVASYLGTNLTGRESEVEALGEGSTGQTELSRQRLGSLPVLVPSMAVQQCFDGAVSPLVKRAIASEVESGTLAALRDAVLPKLISGELRVAHGEHSERSA